MFGQGLVSSVDNFGVTGDAPSHPELLDWLAVDFMENGWTMKRLHRMIVMSNVYRLDSDPAANPLVAKKGPVDPLKIDAFNRGDHIGALSDRVRAEAISRLLGFGYAGKGASNGGILLH